MARAAIILAVLLAGSLAGAAEKEPAEAKVLEESSCGVGKTRFGLKLLETPGDPGSVTVQMTQAGKPAVTVPFPGKAKLSLWQGEIEGETACEEMVAAVSGDAVVAMLAAEARPKNPRAAAFVYRPGRHAVAGAALDLGPLAQPFRMEYLRNGACFASSEKGEISGCYRDKCGKARGQTIIKTETGNILDEWICVSAGPANLKSAVDPEQTWAHLDERVRAHFPSRADFEKAFGWDRAARKYKVGKWVGAIREDASRCVLPSATGTVPEGETGDGWRCAEAPKK